MLQVSHYSGCSRFVIHIGATTLAVVIAGLIGCNQPSGSDWVLVAEADPSTREQELRDKAHAARDALASRLKGRLVEELRASGPVGAVTVCSREAPVIASDVSREMGVRVGRTSHRRRSPGNAPPDWAESLVEQRIDTPTYLRGDDGLNALLPIRVGAECLLCHGDTKAMPAQLVAAIDAKYPNDAARGFAEGDLRGWFWVECRYNPPAPSSLTGTTTLVAAERIAEDVDAVGVGTASDSSKPPSSHPVIEGFGEVVQLPDAIHQPRNGSRVVADITRGGPPEQVNPGLEKVARYVNIFANAGKEPTHGKIVAVLHGAATLSILNDEAYSDEFRINANPNAELLTALDAAGVELCVCGQSLNASSRSGSDVLPVVSVAVSAFTACVNLQQDGFSYVPLGK